MWQVVRELEKETGLHLILHCIEQNTKSFMLWLAEQKVKDLMNQVDSAQKSYQQQVQRVNEVLRVVFGTVDGAGSEDWVTQAGIDALRRRADAVFKPGQNHSLRG